MKKALIFTLLSLSLLLTGCGASEEVRYYNTETIHTFFGQQETRYVYEYDAQWLPTVTVTYQDGQEVSRIRHEYTETGYRMIGTQNGVEETIEYVITYDEEEQPLHIEQYLNGMLYSTQDYTYDENGNLLTHTASFPMANLTTTLENQYDAEGNKTQSISHNGYSKEIRTFVYDSDHRLVQERHRIEGSEAEAVTEYSYAEGGLVETAQIYESSGAYSGKRITTYDQAGNMLRQETYDAQDALRTTTACRYAGTDGSASSGIQ